MEKLLLNYIEIKKQLEDEGGPEENSSLFTELLQLQDTILKKFGLPSSTRYEKILWHINDREDIEFAIRKLEKFARGYLLSSPKTEEKLLTDAVDHKLDPYDVYAELGFTTHDYTCFLYNQILLLGKADVVTVLDELKKTNILGLLSEIFLLGRKSDPYQDTAYENLKNKGLRFLDDYLSFVKEREEDEGEPYEPHYFVINDLRIKEIIFDDETSPTIYCSKVRQPDEPETALFCGYTHLGQILLGSGKFGKVVLDRISQIFRQDVIEKPTVIDLVKEFGESLLIHDIYIEVYQQQEKNDAGEWEEVNYYELMVNRIIERKDLRLSPDSYFREKFADTLTMLQDSYVFYLKLKKRGLQEAECRKRAGLLNELLLYQAYLLYKMENPPDEIDEEIMKEHVFKGLSNTISEKDYADIMEGFWIKWNASSCEILGDADFKNAVYHHLESLDREDYIPQETIDAVIDLVLEYLERTGQWG